MRRLLALAIALIIAVILAIYWSSNAQPEVTAPVPATQHASESSAVPPQEQIHLQEFAAKGRVPAFYETAPAARTLPPTLSPEIFTGNQRLAYQTAKDLPQILAQLPCYCHCDRSIGHKSLHSCFESEHGENCGICIGEAVMAYNLDKQGVDVPEIRRRIIAAYGQ
jgi:hypothetical protein